MYRMCKGSFWDYLETGRDRYTSDLIDLINHFNRPVLTGYNRLKPPARSLLILNGFLPTLLSIGISIRMC